MVRRRFCPGLEAWVRGRYSANNEEKEEKEIEEALFRREKELTIADNLFRGRKR